VCFSCNVHSRLRLYDTMLTFAYFVARGYFIVLITHLSANDALLQYVYHHANIQTDSVLQVAVFYTN